MGTLCADAVLGCTPFPACHVEMRGTDSGRHDSFLVLMAHRARGQQRNTPPLLESVAGRTKAAAQRRQSAARRHGGGTDGSGELLTRELPRESGQRICL